MAKRPKPLGSGRKKGSLNKATVSVRELAQKHTPMVIKRLADVIKAESSTATEVERCAALMLAYAHGKPKEMHEHSGPDGRPIRVSVDVKERIAAIAERVRSRTADRE